MWSDRHQNIATAADEAITRHKFIVIKEFHITDTNEM